METAESDDPADAVWEHRRVVEDIGERVGFVVDLNGRLDRSSVGNRSLNDNYRDAVHFTGKGADAAALPSRLWTVICCAPMRPNPFCIEARIGSVSRSWISVWPPVLLNC